MMINAKIVSIKIKLYVCYEYFLFWKKLFLYFFKYFFLDDAHYLNLV